MKQIKHNIFKNPNWQEADKLAIYNVWKKMSSELPKTNPASCQSGTWTRGLRITSPAP